MALGTLMIINIILVIVAIGLQALLYKNKATNTIFIINILFGILLAYMAYTSFATNFTMQRTIAIALGLAPILGVILKFNNEKYILVSKVMISVSILGSLLPYVGRKALSFRCGMDSLSLIINCVCII